MFIGVCSQQQCASGLRLCSRSDFSAEADLLFGFRHLRKANSIAAGIDIKSHVPERSVGICSGT